MDERAALIHCLQESLLAQPFIHAAWLEGADALGRADEYSDLDLWLDVEAGREEASFQCVREVVASFGLLDVVQERNHPDPLIQQRFYRSTGLPMFLFVDVCVQTHGRAVTFGSADAFLSLFDRIGVLQRAAVPLPDARAMAGGLLARRWRFSLVEKELQRGHILEALAYYHAEVLSLLMHFLRLRYAPLKAEYGLKHVYADLPAEVTAELESLYTLTQPEEIREGMKRVQHWMDATWADWLTLPQNF